MDANILRLIFFILGVGVILGIYLWDRHKKLNARVHAIKSERNNPPSDESITEIKENEPFQEREVRREPAWNQEDISLPYEEEQEQEPAALDEATSDEIDGELKRLDELVRDEDIGGEPVEPHARGEPASFSFTADDPEGLQDELSNADVPLKILQLNILARSRHFSGDDIMCVTRETELKHGDMDIFHRYDAEGRVIFSMASMVEPGTFDLKQMAQFKSPGLILFGQLPGPQDGLVTFSDMLFTAERITALLDGELQDESHSDLSKQTIEHIRGSILEHRRQLQLARSRR
ncbi:cell division protein ZipA [Candidatus Vondammii sp. HM_W22]|uniref:cell division protein ZipA n=1 Tax=Candidatus Vondammii sp. HM_W22 TaxID=2687299 RepID=UPI001F136157|nr:cell division protein ZipA [Candidatus Vondammii sp. HM_W22]